MAAAASQLRPTQVPRRRPAAAPARPPLRLVKPQVRRARWPLALGLVTVLGVFGIVSLSALSAGAAFQASALAEEISSLELRRDELVADVARLEAPDRVRAVAVGDLGMITPERPGFIDLRDAGPLPSVGGPKPVLVLAAP